MTADFRSRLSRVPPRHHKRQLTISLHAVERFRERVDEEFRHRDNEDLSNLLDERLRHSEFSTHVRDPRAPDEITTLRSVACRDATLYAVIRSATVVTVLEEEMARNNFGQPPAKNPVPNTPFAVLRDLKIAPTPPAAAAVVPEPAATPPIPADPLAEAGVAYAMARRHRHTCAENVTALNAALERANEELRLAELGVEQTHKRLIDLSGGGEIP